MLSRFLRLGNWNTLSKIVGVNLIVLLVSFLAIIFYIIPLYERSLLEEHKAYTSGLVDMATSVVNHYHSKELAGELTHEEARHGAIATIRVMANLNDYIWIHDLNLLMVVHPFAPYLERKSLANFRDPSGELIFVKMNQLVKEKDKGFIEYLWPKPKYDEPLPKISCISLFKPWGWVIGSGIYYDDTVNKAMLLRHEVEVVFIFLFAAIIVFSVYAARRINQPLKQALQITSQITRVHREDFKELETSNEPRLLLHAIETMVTEMVDAKIGAESADRAKSDFLARMSHEIRTPMTAISGLTELAMESAVDSEQKEYLEGVRSSAEHLTELINAVLDFSKIDGGHLILEKIPFSLRDTLQATVQPLTFRARQKGLSCEVSMPSEIPDQFVGDPVRLRQIITNLVGNAVKFTRQGGVTITVAESRRDGEDVVLAICVRDTGIGIPPEVREHIFDPFVQADGSMTRKYGGTGLGLAIVRQLVEMMGGRVSVVSEVGRGSEFHFTIQCKLAVNQAPSRKSEKDEHPEASVASTRVRELSVLVAEDVAHNQLIIKRYLEKMGHRATLVENGREAVEAWSSGGFDLVLMDVQMPEMDGLAATRAIRELERSRGGHIPIIAMTAHVMAEDVYCCLEAGMDAHLAKPLKKTDLASALEVI